MIRNICVRFPESRFMIPALSINSRHYSSIPEICSIQPLIGYLFEQPCIDDNLICV